MRRRAATWLKDSAPAPVRRALGRALRLRHAGRDEREVWERELDHEVEYWRRWFAENPGAVRWRTDPTAEVPPHSPLRAVLDAVDGTQVEILDVGAGPLGCLGWTHPGKALRITPTDPLAGAYDDLLDDLGLEPPARTVFAEGERLHERFDDGAFDVACAFNALDHCYDPVAVIASMARVTRPGGKIVLWHDRNEAQHQLYRGLHQWNIDEQGGRLVIWNTRGRRDVSDELADVLDSDVEVRDGRVVAVLTRR